MYVENTCSLQVVTGFYKTWKKSSKSWQLRVPLQIKPWITLTQCKILISGWQDALKSRIYRGNSPSLPQQTDDTRQEVTAIPVEILFHDLPCVMTHGKIITCNDTWTFMCNDTTALGKHAKIKYFNFKLVKLSLYFCLMPFSFLEQQKLPLFSWFLNILYL